MRRLINFGASVNARNLESKDALMFACRSGHVAVVSLLLSKGADPNSRSIDSSALEQAASYGNFECCQVLLKAKANLNEIVTDGPLFVFWWAATFTRSLRESWLCYSSTHLCRPMQRFLRLKSQHPSSTVHICTAWCSPTPASGSSSHRICSSRERPCFQGKKGRRKREGEVRIYFYVLTQTLSTFFRKPKPTRLSTHLVPLPREERNDSSGNSATEATQHQHQQQNLQLMCVLLRFSSLKNKVTQLLDD